MATVLTVGSSDGQRTCDAKCHEAKLPECDCVCGGRYHGSRVVGRDDLGERIERHHGEILAEVTAKGGHVQLALETMINV